MSENVNSVENADVEAPVINQSELGRNGFIKPRKSVSLDARKARAGYAFVLPFIIGVLCIYLPILLDSIWFSMSEEEYLGQGKGIAYNFIGFDYYSKAFGNGNFVANLLDGIQQIIFEVPAVIIFSLFIAVVLNQKMLGRAFFRAVFFLPVIVSTGLMETINAADSMTSASQEGIDDGSGGGGIADQIASTLDLKELFASMQVGGELVNYVVGLIDRIFDIINYSGVQMLIFLAGLQSISPSIYEACRIDGATGWETFWKVTFPMISPMILVNTVYTVIDAFTRSENVMIKFIAEESNEYYATAMSWIYFLVIMLIIAAVAGIVSTFVFYQRRD